MQSTADQILFELKTRGPMKTRDLAARCGVTRQAVSSHLERLAADGLVAHVTAPEGIGRPRQTWSLTAGGHGRFPDTHAQMTVELIAAVRDEFGEAGLARLVDRREQAMAAQYEAALRDAASLEERVARLVRLRAAEGYMAEASADAGGGFVIIQNHCPICAAASACQGFCRSELALFARLLAPARVARVDHMLAGSRRCSYLVTPAEEG
ncbi:MAG: metalloregulator ArsR/SmtB family transcription factor [Acetobacteraceae bacterium]